MLACLGGLLKPGLKACSFASEGRCDWAGPGRAPKPELRRGEPTKSELLLRCGANMLVYREGEEENEGLPLLLSPGVAVVDNVRRWAARKEAGFSA